MLPQAAWGPKQEDPLPGNLLRLRERVDISQAPGGTWYFGRTESRVQLSEQREECRPEGGLGPGCKGQGGTLVFILKVTRNSWRIFSRSVTLIRMKISKYSFSHTEENTHVRFGWGDDQMTEGAAGRGFGVNETKRVVKAHWGRRSSFPPQTPVAHCVPKVLGQQNEKGKETRSWGL